MGEGLKRAYAAAACSRKKAFETKGKAERIGLPLNQYAYECPICHCWHLTKRPQK